MITITLTDENIPYETVYEHYDEAGAWAQANCPSFIVREVVDVCDVSVIHDVLGIYKFGDEKDAVAFKLRWQ